MNLATSLLHISHTAHTAHYRSNILTGNVGSGGEATFSLHTDGFELFEEESVDEVFEESGALENSTGSDEMSVDEDESEATGCSDYSVPSSGTFR